jgi:3-hydroxyacyl-CoA dehydrogenase
MKVYFERRGEVAVLQIDNPPVNGLNLAMRRGLAAGLQRARNDPKVRVVVITGTDRTFSGGADIREFNTPAALAEPNLLQLIDAVESSSKPVIAAINGVCMGGGLELSLACHYRVATPSATMGLPEVKLGLLPGAGGTQRLPRAVGAALALQMIVSGEPIDAEAALKAGLIDRVVPADTFQGVLDFAQGLIGRRTHPRLRAGLTLLPPGQEADEFFRQARVEAARASRGQIAPMKCVDAIEAAVVRPFEEGIKIERALFLELVASEQSKALRHAFFAERAAAKIDVPDDTPTRPINIAAVIGFGTMGAGIAMSFANAGIRVKVLESSQQALDKGLEICRRNWQASANKGRLTHAQVDDRLALLQPTLSSADLAGADIVIEAVFEDMAVKQKVFGDIDRVARRGAILATNTSTLDVNRIAAATRRPADVIGMHFFSPANVMRLLEVVRGDATAPDVLATVMKLARRIRKVAVVCGVCDGFIGNRMLEHYVRQALFMVEEGASPQQIDKALTDFGMAMGIFAVGDLSGLDIGYAIRQRRYKEKPQMRYPHIADRIVELGRLGQKTGKGWYRYEGGSRTPLVDPEVDALIDAYREEIGVAPRAIADEEVVQRCVFALVNEGARILEERIAQRASDIDVVYLTGYGFPAWRGGPMYYAESVGLRNVVEAMQRFASLPNADAAFWQPAPLLAERAASGRRFDAR